MTTLAVTQTHQDMMKTCGTVDGIDGIWVSEGRLRATNGHILVQRAVDYIGPEMLIRITGQRLLAGPDSAEVDLSTLKGPGDRLFAVSHKGKVICVERLAGRFPDTDQVVPASHRLREVAINPKYLLDVQKALGVRSTTGLKMQWHDSPDGPYVPLMIRPNDRDSDNYALIMPMRPD